MFPWLFSSIAEYWGGYYYMSEVVGERNYFRWGVSGAKAVRMLEDILPFLWVKKAQAELVLKVRIMVPGHERDSYEAQISALKAVDWNKP